MIKDYILEQQSKIVADTLNLAQALATAVEYRLLSVEHGGAIFKHFIAQSGIDSPKDKPTSKSTKTYVS